ncbi:hypothetical protein [Gluconobacter cerinus]|uniref:hypothetical protein n=1 Tax=Gluconobacter cerinus TaxID=38307 RepID=UPI003AB8BDFE
MQLPIMNRPLSLDALQEILSVIGQFAPSGTQAQPGIAFGNNQATGFFLKADGSIGSVVNGALSFSINAGGQIDLASAEQTPSQITLTNTNGTSDRCAITFGAGTSSWQMGKDQSADGGNDLFLYNSLTGNTPARWTQDEQLFINWEPTTVLTSNAYDKTGSPLVINNTPGKSRAAVGTSIGMQVNTIISEVNGLSDGTRSEFGSYYGMTFPDPRQIQNDINVWGPDIHVYGKFTDDATQREGLLIGSSVYVRPMAAGSDTKDATHPGAFGAAICIAPPDAGTLAENGVAASKTSYPALAGLSIVGFSGTTAITSGEQSGAGAAATFGLRIGGEASGGGSPYIPWNARSNFVTGASISDFTTRGLWITNPLTAPSGTAQWGIYNECPTYLSGVINAQASALGFFGVAPAAQPTMWQVGGSGSLSDCITAINRITSNLTSLGLFAAA